MLNLTDIVALAKQGYKPNDIKELIALTKEAPAEAETEVQPTTEEAEAETKPIEGNQKDGEASIDSVDYKKEVEALKAQLQETKDKLSLLQKENTKRRADTDEDTKSDAEAFADVMKDFM